MRRNHLAARIKATQTSSRNNSNALVLPAAGAGSTGDAAMLFGLSTLVRNVLGGTIHILDYSNEKSWAHTVPFPVVGVLPQAYDDYTVLAREIGRYDQVFVIGADVLDGRYSVVRSLRRLRFAEFAARAGCKVTVTGFSLNAEVPLEIKRALHRLPRTVRLCARDPRSYERLRNLVRAQLVQVADLAFLLEPSLSSDYERSFAGEIDHAIANGRKPFGVCLNGLSVKLPNLTKDQSAIWLVDCFYHFLQRMVEHEPELLPVLIPHDDRGRWSDVVLNSQLAHTIKQSSNDYLIVNQDVSAAAVKYFVSKMRFVATGRMHLGIAALGTGVPPILFDYQGKVRGLLELFGMDSTVEVSPDPRQSAIQMVHLAKHLLSNEAQTRTRIAQALPEVRRLSALNLI